MLCAKSLHAQIVDTEISVSEALLLFWIDILQLLHEAPATAYIAKQVIFFRVKKYKTLMAGNVMLTKETVEELKGLGSLWVIGGPWLCTCSLVRWRGEI